MSTTSAILQSHCVQHARLTGAPMSLAKMDNVTICIRPRSLSSTTIKRNTRPYFCTDLRGNASELQGWRCSKSNLNVNLICVWPCIINVGKVIWKNQLDATIKIYWSPRSAQHVSGNLLPVFRERKTEIFTAYGIVSCCCGRPGFGTDVKQLPSYRTHSAMLPLSEPRPTTTTEHDIICCKNLSLTLLKIGKRLPKTCWADLGDQ